VVSTTRLREDNHVGYTSWPDRLFDGITTKTIVEADSESLASVPDLTCTGRGSISSPSGATIVSSLHRLLPTLPSYGRVTKPQLGADHSHTPSQSRLEGSVPRTH
jgi:hypothetical protein